VNQQPADRRRQSSEAGFTLIELLVVIIILGILSAVVVFAVRGTGDKGKANAVKIDKRTLQTAQEAFCARFGTYGTEDQLAGLAPAPDGTTSKFLSEKSINNDIALFGGSKCGKDPLTSDYLITGDASTRPPNDTFVVGFGSYTPKEGLNPAVNTAGGMQAASGMLFNGLVGLSANATAVPELADKWDITDNGATYKFTLNPKVVWSDSTPYDSAVTPVVDTATYHPLLAADVKFSYEAALLIHHARTSSSLPSAFQEACTDPGGGVSRRLTCPSIVANEADPSTTPPGKKTVTFKFASPFGSLLQQMPMSDGTIIPSHIFSSCTPGATSGCPTPTAAWPANQPPVGTGPFKVNYTESNSTDGLVYDKNTNYWRTGIPYFNKVKLSTTTGLTALKAGTTIDYVTSLGTIADVNAAKADPNLVVDTGTMAPGGSTNCTQTVMFNLWAQGQTPAGIRGNTASPHPQLGDKAPTPMIDPDGPGPEPSQPRGRLVRRAIAMSLEREASLPGKTNDGYVKISGSPGAELATSPTNTGMPVGSTPAPLPEYNVDADVNTLDANGLLDAAGFTRPGGTGTRFSLGLSNFASSPVAEAIKLDLAKVGIDVTPNTNIPGVTTINVTQGQIGTLFSARNFDMVFVSSCQNTDPEMGTRRVYHVDAINGASFTNGSGYNNPTVNSLFNQGRESIDPAVRNQKYKQINDTVRVDLPTLWLLQTKSNRAYKATCSGLRPYTGAYPEYGSCAR